MAVNLTTIPKLKTFIGLDLTQSESDDLLRLIINSVSEQIARHTDRTFERTTYKRWYDGSGTQILRLPNYPITRVYGVATNTESVGSIQYSGSGDLASVDLNSSGLTLVNINDAGTDTTTRITLSGKSVTELSTSINAQSGWSFSVDSGQGGRAATQLRPFSGGDAKDASDLDFYHPEEYRTVRVLSQVSDSIELIDDVFPCGYSNIFVWYVAGYELPGIEEQDLTVQGTLPQGLELICNQACADIYAIQASDTDRSMDSERLGDYQYKLGAGVVTAAVKRYGNELQPFMKKHL